MNNTQKDQRARLVGSALEAFAEAGFVGASLREIATRTGCAIGLIRYYSGNKNALWNGVLRDLSEKFAKEFADVLDNRTEEESQEAATERLAEVIRWFIDLSARHPALSRLIVAESNHKGVCQRAVSRLIVRPFCDLIASSSKTEGFTESSLTSQRERCSS